MNKQYRAETLANGLIRVFDYVCKWDGLFNKDGSHRSGSLRLPKHVVLELVR